MTTSPKGIACAAVLVLAICGAVAAPAGKVQGASSEGTAGEVAAQAYCEQNHARFAAYAPVISPGQTAAALAEGENEGPRVRQVRPPSDGGMWTLPGRYVRPE